MFLYQCKRKNLSETIPKNLCVWNLINEMMLLEAEGCQETENFEIKQEKLISFLTI